METNNLNSPVQQLSYLNEQAPFSQLLQHSALVRVLNECQHRLDANVFNLFWQKGEAAQGFQFVPQASFTDDKRYYEQIIFQDNIIPSRDNWHDFFNAFIWSQFSQCKAYLNRLHMQEIQLAQSPKQRSKVRDRMTHFDECGIVIVTCCEQFEQDLRAHDWQSVFLNGSYAWHTKTLPIIFGHAMWEMLMQAHIGLTAKAKVIVLSEDEIGRLATIKQERLYQEVDSILLGYFEKGLFQQNKPFLPLPILGIPNWSPFAQTSEFYQNQRYFMPKR